MESSPSSSTWSEAFILSDDSGLLLTNESTSSVIGESQNGRKLFNFEDSDCEEKSLSQDDSLDGMSDIMCGDNFNTLKKGVHWTDFNDKHCSPIKPPLQFQDDLNYPVIDFFCENLSQQIIETAIQEHKVFEPMKLNVSSHVQKQSLLSKSCFPSEFVTFSPYHIGRSTSRAGSRNSLGSSRLSSSHNSLSIPTTQKVDDSTFITQAVSHDTLSLNQISDLYNVPFDSDIYAVPVDMVKRPLKLKKSQQQKRKRRNISWGYRDFGLKYRTQTLSFQNGTKRHSLAGTSASAEGEPIHVTLQEIRHYLQTLYSSSSDSLERKEKPPKIKTVLIANKNRYPLNNNLVKDKDLNPITVPPSRSKKNTIFINIKNKKVKDSCDTIGTQIHISPTKKDEKTRKTLNKLFSLKQMLCNMFRFKRFLATEQVKEDENNKIYASKESELDNTHGNISGRALPPLPNKENIKNVDSEQMLDFATSIQRVKDFGWYWGPISSEAAEKILSNEPDGSFIVRDSSDDHYIFSLTFKLNNCVRHVRIEHDQGNFSFGSCTKFKSQTIVEFIENAVEHSRSGRYLFFLHRRPVIGPVRVQLLHPVSRFKQVQSLQHLCRFVIHKNVRMDLIPNLPLPRRMIDYLNTPYYYTEHLVDVRESDEMKRNDVLSTGVQNNVQLVNNLIVPVNNYVVNNPSNVTSD
ncbi:uncharacterized protein LOC130444820 [Diorhabda sublineata]|uniref:uncharacterized protein LOC130444820 n=1 Tax=Diorhabda sublineata TaxID=1163346 RepID=UPI0024E1492D|nr:uncharacterized protein LOC130444820 [Diorhabda sublineata]